MNFSLQHAELARLVFGNKVIASTILSFTTDDPINNLGLRVSHSQPKDHRLFSYLQLVSRAFDKEILKMVRDEYRSIYIRKPREFDDNFEMLKVNKKTVLVRNFLRFFK